jgi:hypothetical protein
LSSRDSSTSDSSVSGGGGGMSWSPRKEGIGVLAIVSSSSSSSKKLCDLVRACRDISFEKVGEREDKELRRLGSFKIGAKCKNSMADTAVSPFPRHDKR